MILKKIKNFFSPRKKESYPFNIRWDETKLNKELAQKKGDFKLIQIANSELLWYKTVYKYFFQIEKEELNVLNLNFYSMHSGKVSEEDKKIIEFNTYKRIKDVDLIIPETFDFNNKLHYEYCLNISDVFQDTLRELNNQGIDILFEKDLKISKLMTHKAIIYLTKSNGFNKNDNYSMKEFWKSLFIDILCKVEEVKQNH